MTAAIVVNSAWNIRNFRKGLLRALLEAGHRVVVIAPGAEALGEDAGAGDVLHISLVHLRRKGLNPLRDVLLLRELAVIYRRERVDVALHFTIKPIIYGSLAARWTGTRNVSTLTGLGYTFLTGGAVNRLVRRLYRFALASADRVFFHNSDDLALFTGDGLVDAGRAAVVPGSGLNAADFPYADFADAVTGRFLFAGRLLIDKGIREYVAAARLALARRPDLAFHIVGGLDPGNPASVPAAELQGWIDEGTVVYENEAPDIRMHLRAAALIVLPSYREGCPRVLLEAGATGRPVIACDVPGSRFVVDPGVTGWLTAAKDVSALTATLLSAAETPPDALAEMGRAGRRRVEEHFRERVVNAAYLRAIG